MIREPDPRSHVTALTALLSPALAPFGVFEHGDVPGLSGNPGAVPECYAVLQVERMPLPILQSSRLSSRTSWWVQVRVADSSSFNCSRALSIVTEVLENALLSVGAFTSTPLAFDVHEAPAPDDGMYSGAISYTYSL